MITLLDQLRRFYGIWPIAFGFFLLAASTLPANGIRAEATKPGDEAGDNGSQSGVDQDRARQAVADGEIMPLHEILARVHGRYRGRVLEVLLKDREAGLYGWVYDIHLLTPDRRVLLFRVDAGTGSILRIDGVGDAAGP